MYGRPDLPLLGTVRSIGALDMDERSRLIISALAAGRLPSVIPEDLEYADELKMLSAYLTECYRFAIDISSGDFAHNHVGLKGALAGSLKTLQATNNLATVLGLQGKFAEDAAVLDQALTDGRKTLGPEHQLVRNILNSLAAAYVSKGDFVKAEPLLRESLAINVRAEGEHSPSAALAKYNLACLMARVGDKEAALALVADAVDHGLIPDAALQLESDDDLAALRTDPRFQAVVRRAKDRYGNRS